MLKYALLILVLTDAPTFAAEPTTCQPSGHTRLWAQQAAATDLAQAFLAAKRIPRLTKIGIVDSGFDDKLLPAIRNSNFNKKSAVTSLPLMPTDPIGHGTVVTGLIKGEDGIGSSIDSPVSLYTENSETIKMSSVVQGMLKACREGADILSVSIGTELLPALQIPLSAQINPASEKELSASGCLVVHAAGNDGSVIKVGHEPYEFEIGATDPLGQRADFSDSGDFLMPGERVVSLRSSEEPRSAGDLSCDGQNEWLASGTSFAAPMFAAHLAMVRDTMLLSAKFKALTRSQQGEVLRQITAASTIGGIVNSYYAVRLAYAWAMRGSLQTAQASLAQECSKSVPSRASAILCQGKNPELSLTLAQNLENQGDLEGAAYWFNAWKAESHDARVALPFPTRVLEQSLVSGSDLSRIARWIDYAKFRGNMTQAQPLLTKAAAQALANINQTLPRLASADAAREFVQVALFALKQSPKTVLPNLISSLRATKYSEFALTQLLITGHGQHVLKDYDLATALEILTAPGRSAADATAAAWLLKDTVLPFKIQSVYLDRLLAGQVPSDAFEQLTLVGLNSDSSSNQDIANWLTVLQRLLKSRDCSSDQAYNIAVALFASNDLLPRANKADLRQLLQSVYQANAPGSQGRQVIDYLWARLIF